VLALLVLAFLVSVLFASAVLFASVVPGFVREILLDPLVRFLRPVAPWSVLLIAFAGLALCLRWLLAGEENRQPSYLKNRADGIAGPDLLGVRYVIMGHTHDAELYTLGEDGGRRKKYFNTGTWTTVFSEEERLIRKPVEFVFVQGERAGDGLALMLLEWNDGAGEPRLLKLFRDENNAEP